MSNQIETKRLILREIIPSDEKQLFQLDSDPEVIKYIGIPVLTNVNQTRELITKLLQQYLENAIGRWAVIEKESNQFIGWSGLKFYKDTVNNHSNFYDLGYRFLKEYWGKGYATETSKVWLEYAFNELNQTEVFATTDVNHQDSKNVLQKVGFKHIEIFDDEGDMTDWWKVTKESFYQSILL